MSAEPIDVHEVTEPSPEPEPSSTEVAVRTEETTMALADALPLIPGADEFRSMAMQAKILSSSMLVPAALRGKPHDTLLVLMTGRDLGIAPTAALRKCYVVDGQVTIAPALKLALVKIKGLGCIRPAPNNNRESATAVAFDAKGQEIGRLTLGWSDVCDIEYASGKKLVDKDNWRNYPARMLWWRCAGYLVDDLFPEVAFGLYTPDEIGALTDEEGHVIDVREIPVPEGYESKRNDPAPVTFVSEADGEGLRLRANDLPGGARLVFKAMLTEREIGGFPMSLPTSKLVIVTGILDGLEKRAESGEWGEWHSDPGTEWEIQQGRTQPVSGDSVRDPADPVALAAAALAAKMAAIDAKAPVEGPLTVPTAPANEVDRLIEASLDPTLTVEARGVIADRLMLLETIAELPVFEPRDVVKMKKADVVAALEARGEPTDGALGVLADRLNAFEAVRLMEQEAF